MIGTALAVILIIMLVLSWGIMLGLSPKDSTFNLIDYIIGIGGKGIIQYSSI